MVSRSRFSWLRAVAIFCLTSLLTIGIALQPSFSQPLTSSPERAAVVIDGRVLFRLGSIDGFTAERRVSSVNADLQRALQRRSLGQPIPVAVLQRNELTTIRVDNRHLLTVTEGDFRRGVTPQEQAEEWEEILEMALGRSQQERMPVYTQMIIWRVLGALVGAIALSIFIRWGRRQLWRRWTQSKDAFTYSRQLITPALFCLEMGVWLAFLT